MRLLQHLADGVGHIAHQRHLDEHQRLVNERGMEEGEAAPIGRIEAAAQVVPPLDLVHRLIADDLVEDRRRRVPVDAAQNEKAAVEPGVEQAPQVGVNGGERRIGRRYPQQVVAHADDLVRGAGREVETAEELDPRAL